MLLAVLCALAAASSPTAACVTLPQGSKLPASPPPQHLFLFGSLCFYSAGGGAQDWKHTMQVVLGPDRISNSEQSSCCRVSNTGVIRVA